jgi:hypothetical protein
MNTVPKTQIKHSLPKIQAKLRRLDAKSRPFIKWADESTDYPRTPIMVGATTQGYRIGRRYDRIADKYGII